MSKALSQAGSEEASGSALYSKIYEKVEYILCITITAIAQLCWHPLLTYYFMLSLHYSVSREIDGLRQQVTILSSQIEEERERYVVLESKMRQTECEARASQLAFQDERLRNEETHSRLTAEMAALEEKYKSLGRMCDGNDDNQP